MRWIEQFDRSFHGIIITKNNKNNDNVATKHLLMLILTTRIIIFGIIPTLVQVDLGLVKGKLMLKQYNRQVCYNSVNNYNKHACSSMVWYFYGLD